MTIKQAYSYTLTELNKVEAPAMLLDDFIYFMNKAIILFYNERYMLYEVNQQLTDDLRVLTGKATLNSFTLITDNAFPASYKTVLPADYWHILNCSVKFAPIAGKVKCNTGSAPIFKGTKRMTSQMYSGLIDNYYLKPSHKNSYYYLRNTGEPVISADGIREQGDRMQNTSPVNIEIIYGTENDKYELTSAHVDYLKIPKYVSITEDEIDSDEDESQVLEFPHTLCLEIIKKLVALLMENFSDPRLNTNLPINQAVQPGTQRR